MSGEGEGFEKGKGAARASRRLKRLGLGLGYVVTTAVQPSLYTVETEQGEWGIQCGVGGAVGVVCAADWRTDFWSNYSTTCTWWSHITHKDKGHARTLHLASRLGGIEQCA